MRKIVIIIGVITVVAALFLFITGRGKDRDQVYPLIVKLEEARKTVKEADLQQAEQIYREIIDEFKDSPEIVIAIEELADLYKMQNQLLEARSLYEKIIRNFPESERIQETQKKLGNLNIDILFSREITDKSIVYEVKPGDTLGKIARAFNTTADLIKESNNLTSDTIRPYDRLKLVTADFSLVIDKSQNTLALRADDQLLKVYSVSTGKENRTPTGEFKIINKLKNPVWYKAGAVVPAESPENILGSRWLGLSIEKYGIHGTTEPESIGEYNTEGCVRMTNEDVEELFIIVQRGTKVTIVD
jgi:lipoprotein-anchoring transpeptidase ErfK/SrfK